MNSVTGHVIVSQAVRSQDSGSTTLYESLHSTIEHIRFIRLIETATRGNKHI